MSHNGKNQILLTFLWPFAGLISAIKNWRQPWAMNVFWLACVYMGIAQIFLPSSGYSGCDGLVYVQNFQDMYHNVHSFSTVANSFYKDQQIDIYAPIVGYLVSRLTDNGHVLFFVYALVFGFFYSRNLWYIFNKMPTVQKSGFWVLVAFWFLVCPIWQINGVRMWTAVHVFAYGALPYLLDENKKSLIWSFLSILVHHSFIFPALLIIAFAFLPDRVKGWNKLLTVLFVVYLLSLTVKALDLGALNALLQSYLPDYYEGRIDGYVDETQMDIRREQSSALSSYVGVLQDFMFWAKQVLVIFAFIAIRKNDKFKPIIPLFAFALLFGAFASVASNVPSGGRFVTVSNMFIVPALMFVAAYNDEIELNFINKLAYTILAVALLFNVRIGLDYYGLSLIFGNFLTALFIETNTPIIVFIKYVI